MSGDREVASSALKPTPLLPTFVIGLREGLEAALIVSIIAAFLRRNGLGLRSMWLGVALAVAISIGVGVVLDVVEQGLPQREQEGMETVIGAVAVVFVTGMILWMRTHARFMKRELESAAQSALGAGTATALTVMVFLAVLREGFETSVFLLSTFNASTDPATSATGAVLGIGVAVLIGYGIYTGGVRLNLSRFFSITGVFLIFVAAGLVLSALRTGHEAGWVDVGQGRTLDLGWLAPNGAVRTSVITGVLGIPADPRVIEMLGWCCYVVPMLALTLWPARLRPAAHLVPRLRLAGAGVLAVLAVVLFLAVPLPGTDVDRAAPLDTADGASGGKATVRVTGASATVAVARTGQDTETLQLGDPRPTTSRGADTAWSLAPGTAGADLPDTLDVAALLDYTGRVPVGLDVDRTPGPYDASWAEDVTVTVLTRGGGLVDGSESGTTRLTLTGGGLTSPRVVTVSGDSAPTAWQVDPDHVATTTASVLAQQARRQDRELWKHWFPAFLVLAALVLLVGTVRRRRREPTLVAERPAGPPATPEPAAVAVGAHASGEDQTR